MSKGNYIVIEGPEGVGKTTQIQFLANALGAENLPVRVMREPDSQSDLTARSIRRITQDPQYPMNTRTEVLLYNAARSQSLEIIRNNVQQGVTCLVDRNYLTTLALQYYGRGDVPDYDKINTIIQFAVGDMEPDLTIVLDAEVSTLLERLKYRYQGDRFDNLDAAMLERIRAGYLWEAKQRGLPIVYAVNSPEEVFRSIWQVLSERLSFRPSQTRASSIVGGPQSVATILAARPGPDIALPSQSSAQDVTAEVGIKDYLSKDANGKSQPSSAGIEYLKTVVTNTDQSVYAFSEELSPITIAAAMARLSRRGDDMRITILDEFANQVGKDQKLLQRVISAYGDDSVQQLAGLHVVVEKASNLLTKLLEWGRLASYLEQSTRYIYFDQKDSNGLYNYYVPEEFDIKTKQRYTRDLDKIFDLYSELVHKLTDYVQKSSSTPEKERDGAWKTATRAQACDAARPLLPVATQATVGIYASGQALENLIMHLMSDELPEANRVGQQLLDEARKIVPVLLERADKPDRGGATIAYRANTYRAVKKLSKKYLTNNYAEESPAVTLVDFWPRNELDLIADMAYDQSELPLSVLQEQVKEWSYQQKQTFFKAYMGERLNRRHRPGRAIEKAHYSWDIVCDYGIFRDLQRHRMVDDLEWQKLTPRYGYEIPELVEKADLSYFFDEAFEVSLKLYSALQPQYPLEAQYATLLGNKMRWKVTYNAREAFHLHELRTSPQGHPGYRKLVQQMHEKMSEVHPLLAEAMIFVNKGEDAELTRLAAERYTQFKLEQLSD